MAKRQAARRISLYLKDVAEFGKVDAEEVPWKTGKGDIRAILAEIRRQGIKPVIAIEYERQGDTLADLRLRRFDPRCIYCFRET